MTIQTIKKHRTLLVSAVIVVALAVPFVAWTAFARIMSNTIDPVARVTDNGRRLILTGPLRCDQSQRTPIRVTVTQRSTGAVAEGQAFIDCSTTVQQWEVHAFTQGRETFAEGPAAAVAVARTATGHGEFDDSHQWLVNITLVNQ
jgi:hypothetical protein